MSKREWVRSRVEGTANELRVGDLVAVAHDACSCGCGVGPEWLVRADVRAVETDTLDHAKELAEGKLREMHDALNEHFAPVLRWELNNRGGGFASFGLWRLSVEDDGWWQVRVSQKTGDVVESVGFARGKVGDTPSARRAAEAALRALGVVFRTEGE